MLDGRSLAPDELEELKLFRSKKGAINREATVVGMKYRPYKNTAGRKRPGHTLILVPEPANRHDKNAVAVYGTHTEYGRDEYTWVHLGYLSSNTTHLIQDRSKIYEAKILNKAQDYWDVLIENERVF